MACGCVEMNGSARGSEQDVEPARIAFHVAYDEPREGCREMTDEEGQKVYVSPVVELTRRDVDVVRALRGQEHSLLQIVLTRIGAQRLRALTGAHTNDRLAVLINDELVCAPRIYGEVVGGEIRLVGIFSRERTEELAAALNAR